MGLSLTGCTTYNNFHAAFFEKDKEQEVIKIGIFEPQTGADAADAAEEIKGIELAHELYPEVMGKRVEFVYGDNQSDVEMARTVAQQLVDSGVRLVLGSYKSTLSLAGSDVFEAADIPAIGISIKNPIVTQTNEFYFRVCFVDAFQGISAAYYVHDYLKQNDAVCFKQAGDDYAETMIEQFAQRMDRLTAGTGKVTVHVPKRSVDIMQTTVPEAVLHIDHEETAFSEPVDTEDFDAVAIGPGLGQTENTAIAMIAQVRRTQCPLVMDADALNMLAKHRAWMQQLPKALVMTPHPLEFDRLNGSPCNDSYERLSKARDMAELLQAYIILKGHHSALCLPDGQVYFNSSGNAGMATAGSGDVLTGIITGLLARGYSQADACLMGMYLHGLAGDLAARELGEESLIASDIIRYLPQAFSRIQD